MFHPFANHPSMKQRLLKKLKLELQISPSWGLNTYFWYITIVAEKRVFKSLNLQSTPENLWSTSTGNKGAWRSFCNYLKIKFCNFIWDCLAAFHAILNFVMTLYRSHHSIPFKKSEPAVVFHFSTALAFDPSMTILICQQN